MKIYKVDRYWSDVWGWVYYAYYSDGEGRSHIKHYVGENPEEVSAFVENASSVEHLLDNAGRPFCRFS